MDPVRGVSGASFNYYLRTPADSVKVDILDARGAVIRSFTGTKSDSARAAAARDTTRAAKADSVIRRESIGAATGCDTRQQQDPKPKTAAGLNRFNWDLRYPGATTFDCMILWGGSASGPDAPPGQYRVRLTANGRTETQSFTVRRDPRLIGVTDADLREQFTLAQKINKRVSDANDAVIRIRVARDRLQKRDPSSPFIAKLTKIEGDLYQVRNRSGQDPLNFPIRLNNRLAALQRSVETGDARPTAAAYVVFKELSAELDRELAELDATLKTAHL